MWNKLLEGSKLISELGTVPMLKATPPPTKIFTKLVLTIPQAGEADRCGKQVFGHKYVDGL